MSKTTEKLSLLTQAFSEATKNCDLDKFSKVEVSLNWEVKIPSDSQDVIVPVVKIILCK